MGETIARAEARRLELLGLTEDAYDDEGGEYLNRGIALSYGYDHEAVDWDVYWEVQGALIELDVIDPESFDEVREFLDEAGEFAGEVEEFALKVSARPARD